MKMRHKFKTMITRSYTKGDAPSGAVYSDCERYRYSLTRSWDTAGKRLHFVMLNPSKATERQNDPTVERCERRARALGYGAFSVTNIFAWRETDPFAMRRVAEPIGPHNDTIILEKTYWSDCTIAAWGTHGAHMDRGADVENLLRMAGKMPCHLGLTKHGHPRHPLYVAYTQAPVAWT